MALKFAVLFVQSHCHFHVLVVAVRFTVIFLQEQFRVVALDPAAHTGVIVLFVLLVVVPDAMQQEQFKKFLPF